MTPTFNVSNNFPTASGDKRKITKSHSFITPKKGTKEIDSAANILSPNTLEAAISIVDLAEKEKGEDLKKSAKKFATGNGNIINPSV